MRHRLSTRLRTGHLLAAAALGCAAGCQIVAGVRTDAEYTGAGGDTSSGGGGSGGTTSSGGGGAAPTCTDGDKNGAETGVDCGGATDCPRCADGETCDGPGDCQDQSCILGICCVPTPFDALCMGKCDEVTNNCGEKVSCPECTGTLTCGGGGLPNVCGSCALPPCFVWSKAYGDGSPQGVRALAADAAGNVFVTGDLAGSIDLGGGSRSAPVGAFVAKLDPAGKHLWSKAFEGASFTAAAADGQGALVLAGSVQAAADFGGGPLSGLDFDDIVLVKLDASGDHVFSKGFPSSGGASADLALAPDGSLYLGGCFTGDLALDPQAPIASTGPSDLFLAKLTPDAATAAWVKRIGGPTAGCGSSPPRVASDTLGNVFFAASFTGDVTLGATLTDDGDGDLLAGKWLPEGGNVFLTDFGGPLLQTVADIAVDGAGNLILAGFTAEPISFGGPALPTSGVYVAKLTGAGAHTWSVSHATGCASALQVATTPGQDVVLTGALCAPITFDTELVPDGFEDVFAAKLTAMAGAPVWSRRFGDMDAQSSTAVAADGPRLFLGGAFKGTLDFTLGLLNSAGDTDAFVLKLIP